MTKIHLHIITETPEPVNPEEFQEFITETLNTEFYKNNLTFNTGESITELYELLAEHSEKIQKYQKELITIKNTINEAYNTERTHLGHNTLKQLKEALQI